MGCLARPLHHISERLFGAFRTPKKSDKRVLWPKILRPKRLPKKGKLKLIIMLVIIIILAVGLSVVGTLWFLGGGLPGADDAETTTSAEPRLSPAVIPKLRKPW